jgi:hypothetical protein
MTDTARPACSAKCLNARTPASACSHDCPDHGAAHRRVTVESTPERQAAAFARLPVAPSDEEW